jgi:hypothetical protein
LQHVVQILPSKFIFYHERTTTDYQKVPVRSEKEGCCLSDVQHGEQIKGFQTQRMLETFPFDQFTFVVVSVRKLIVLFGFFDRIEIESNDLLFDFFDVLFVE